MSDPKHSKLTLGDDGELHQQLENPANSVDAIFCVHCTAANLPDSKFCRECGKSLLEQQKNFNLEDADSSKEKQAAHLIHEPSSALEDPYLKRLNARLDRAEQVGSKQWKTLSLIVLALVVFFPFYAFAMWQLQDIGGLPYSTGRIISLTLYAIWLALTIFRRAALGILLIFIMFALGEFQALCGVPFLASLIFTLIICMCVSGFVWNVLRRRVL